MRRNPEWVDLDATALLGTKRPRFLTNLRITEISSVDKGANPGAKILIWKRDDSADEYSDTPSPQRKRLQQIFAKAFTPPDEGTQDRTPPAGDTVVENDRNDMSVLPDKLERTPLR